MPIHDYRCDHCGHTFSAVQSYTDAALEVCPSCGAKPRKLMATPAIVFKGGGWYKTDSRVTPKEGPAEAAPASGDAAKSESATSGAATTGATKTDASPAKADSGTAAPAKSGTPATPATPATKGGKATSS